MRKFEIEIVGANTLLMHNGRLSNPLDPAAKLLKTATSKTKKTDDDHETTARVEFLGSLYIADKIGPYLPGDNVWRSLFDAAKKTKRGVRVKEGLLITTDFNPLAYTGPRVAEDLWADENFRNLASVKVGMSRVMRCRPQFREWSCVAEGAYDENVIDLSEIEEIAATAGTLIGLGDWRPRFGRYRPTVKEI